MMYSLVLVAVAVVVSAQGPCDLFESGGTPCVAAHSLVRALFNSYNGSLYQVKRLVDNATHDIGVISTGGFANASAQDEFCGRSGCVVQRIYDQSSYGNHLDIAPPGEAHKSYDNPVNATRNPITASGRIVYSAYFEGAMGYRNDKTVGVATLNEPETLYMVTSGTHVNAGCCFDYGNAEISNDASVDGSMEAVYFGTSKEWGYGAGNGPWAMADLENGLWPGNQRANPSNTPLTTAYVTAMVKGGTDGFALKGGDATHGGLVTFYDGPRPKGYQPMKKQGAIVLGIGGDNSDWAVGTFYEGAITTGYSTDAVDVAVQANIVQARYGQ